MKNNKLGRKFCFGILKSDNVDLMQNQVDSCQKPLFLEWVRYTTSRWQKRYNTTKYGRERYGMKKLLAVLLSLMLAMSMVACGGEEAAEEVEEVVEEVVE